MDLSLKFSSRLKSFVHNDPYSTDFRTASGSVVPNGVFNKWITINIEKEILEIPVFCYQYVRRIIESDYAVKEVNISLGSFYKYGCNEVKGTPTIFRILENITFRDRLFKFAKDNNVYYIGKGIILDIDKNPLFLAVVNSINDGEEFSFIKDIGCKIYINPSVFTSDDFLCKSLRRTVIPFYLENGLNLFGNLSKMIIPEICISNNINYWFVGSSTIDHSFTNDNINDFLGNNTESVTDIILQ